MKTELFLCECSFPEHQLIVTKDEEDEDFHIIVSIHLTMVPFWSRVKNAFKYVFYPLKQRSDFEEVILSKDKTQELIKFLQ